MNIETVEYRVRKLIANQVGISVNEVAEDSDLRLFNIDSLDVMEIVMALEDTFKIKIESEEEGLDSVDKVINLVKTKITGA